MRPWTKRLAAALPWVLAGGLATAVTLVALAPAAWIAPQFARATGAHVNLVDPDGSLWHGSGTLMLASGADQSAATLLPGRVEWTTGFWPLLTGRVQMRMRQTE
ncbi:type II secretion system protein N, partial [Burkholderia sp. RS02]|uniref:type II secretion system protein N n=1 Tax=unclassified Burkholderia TaxID=2613784 RepID=UPI003218B452